MHNDVLQDVTAAVAKNRRKSIWKRIVSVLACIVVFCTTYALILPALTLERAPECGMEEHAHVEACYIKDDASAEETLVCNAETLALHLHTDGCIGIDGEYICGYSDFVVHSHNEFCFDENGVLVCTLPEIFPHTHTDDCYIVSDGVSELTGEIDGSIDNALDGGLVGLDGVIDSGIDLLGHIHTDDCYITERGELICTLSAEDVHVHTDECYSNTDALICTMPEGEGHIHGEGCFDEAGALTCTLPESEGHTHAPECYQSNSALVCTLTEGAQAHVHADECYAQSSVLVCEIPEEPSLADSGSALPSPEGEAADGGYAQEGVPAEPYPENTIPENDINNIIDDTTEAGDRGEPVCGMAEIILHSHDESCFDGSGMLICGMTEVLEHIHTQECMGALDSSDELTCTIAEGDGAHIHTAEGGCFDEEGTLVCEIPESEGHVHGTICYGSWTLICEIEEHVHTDECYPSDEPEADPSREVSCGKEEHTHAGECIDGNGVVVCAVEEHKHGEECYADASAEQETFCGKEEHTHAGECVDANGVISCGVEEHEHGGECYVEEVNNDDSGIFGEPIAIAYIVESDGVETYGLEAYDIMTMAADAAASTGAHNFAPDIDTVDMLYWDGSKWADGSNHKFKKGETVRFKLNYTLDGYTLKNGNKDITYQMPASVLVNNAESGRVSDPSGTPIGDFVISKEGLITITFFDSYYNSNNDYGNKIMGSVVVDAVLSDDLMNNENAQIQFRKDLIVNVPVDTTVEDKSSVWVNKTAGNVNPDTGEVVFTIEVGAGQDGTTNPVELVDTMPGLTLVGDITIDRDSSTYTKTTNADGSGFTIKFNDKMAPNEKYTITYTAKFANISDTSTADLTANNTITAKTKKNDGSELVVPKTVPVTYSQKYLSKTGSLSADKKTIAWTININEGGQNIGGWTLDDTLNGVSISDRLPLTMTAADGSSLTVDTLPFTFPEGTKSSYTIVYTTPVEVPLYGYSSKNKVILKDPAKDPIEVEANVDVLNNWEHYNPLKKEALAYKDNGNGTIDVKYRVTINADKGGIPAPWTYTDSLVYNQYFTDAQKNAISDSLSAVLSPGKYSLNWTYTGSNCTGFIITFTEKLPAGGVITFDYAATGTISDPDKEQEFKNSGNINNKVFGEGSIKYAPLVQKHDNDSWNNPTTEYDYKSRNGILKWKVIVSPPAGYTGGALTVTEQLPEGVELQKLELWDSYTDKKQDIAVPNTYYFDSYGVTSAKDGQKVTITIPESFVKAKEIIRFEFYIEVKINEDVKYDEINDGKPAHSFVNSVNVRSADGNITGVKQQTQVITKDDTLPVLTKKHGAYSDEVTATYEENSIPYSITVNPEGKDLIGGTDTLTLVDTIISYDTNSYTFNLVPGTLAAYNINKDGTKGAPLSPTKYGYHLGPDKVDGTRTDYVINMTIPDKTPLIIEYSYRINSEHIGTGYTLENSAYLVGVADAPKANDKVYMVVSDSIAQATTSGMTIVKVDSRSDGIALEGAQFALYIYSKDKGDYIPAKDSKTQKEIILTTPKNGIVYINDVKYNTAYKLVENIAPDGYIKAKDPYYFWLPHDDKTTYPEEKPANFTGNIHSGGDVLYYANEKSTTEIEVIKQWVDEKGNDVTADRSDSIQFELWRKKYVGGLPGSSGGGVTIQRKVYKYNESHDNTLYDDIVKDADGNVPQAGATIKITATATYLPGLPESSYPTLKIDGAAVNWSVDANNVLTYQFEAKKDSSIYIMAGNYLFAYADCFKFEVINPASTGSGEPETELVPGYVPFTLSKENNWYTEIPNLKKFEVMVDEQGNEQTVYYTYYVQEITTGIQDLVGLPVYTNNDGITSGTITITNTVTTTPQHELPQTGGGGAGKTTALGVGVMAITLILALVKKAPDIKKRGKEDFSSS